MKFPYPFYQWRILYSLLASLFLIFNILWIFLQKPSVRLSYLHHHADNLEHQKDYQNAIRIWEKLYHQNPQNHYYLVRVVQNYFLQANFPMVIQTIENYEAGISHQDTLLLLLKYGLYSAQKVGEEPKIQAYIQKVNKILKINTYWEKNTRKWIYVDEQFAIPKLRKWVDVMYPLLNQDISLYTLQKEEETSFYYFHNLISLNKLSFLQNEHYEAMLFNQSTRISPDKLYPYIPSDKLGFLWASLRRINFTNPTWFDALKKELNRCDLEHFLQFLYDAKVIVPVSYQIQNYTFNTLDYGQLPSDLYRIFYKRLKEIKNLQEIEKLQNVFVYLQMKINLR